MPRKAQPPFKIIRSGDHVVIHMRRLPPLDMHQAFFTDIREKVGRKPVKRVDWFLDGEQLVTRIVGDREYYPCVGDCADPPAMRAVHERSGLVIPKCPYCGKRHVHGADGGGGHRVAHCIGMQSQGYVLEVADADKSAEMA